MHENKPRPTTELCDQITSEIDAALDTNQMAMKGLGRVTVREIIMPPEPDIPDDFYDPNQGVLFDD